jgi:crotonobetainyl-CoA:carnitine CoA-transferase CaiB-like acyl-CoA transferase
MRDGNRGPVAAPQNLYRCRGDDRWLALAVADDAQWRSLREALGDPVWARDPAFTTAAGRRARHDAIDSAIAAWCAEQDVDAAAETLTRRGIPPRRWVAAARLATIRSYGPAASSRRLPTRCSASTSIRACPSG